MTLELLKKTKREIERIEICNKVCSVHKAMTGLRWVLRQIKDGRDVSEIEAEVCRNI
jgi:hypothetical protein